MGVTVGIHDNLFPWCTLGVENRTVNAKTSTQTDKPSGRYWSNVFWETQKRDCEFRQGDKMQVGKGVTEEAVSEPCFKGP